MGGGQKEKKKRLFNKGKEHITGGPKPSAGPRMRYTVYFWKATTPRKMMAKVRGNFDGLIW